jgi:hypothetical protein
LNININKKSAGQPSKVPEKDVLRGFNLKINNQIIKPVSRREE